MKDYLETEFYNFLKDELDVDLNENSPNLSLEKDLKIYGDEAVDFLHKFSTKFNVDIENFNFNKYFNSEIDMISLFIKNSKYELTIDDLKRSIVKGKLE